MTNPSSDESQMVKESKVVTEKKGRLSPQARRHWRDWLFKPASWPTTFPDRYEETYLVLMEVEPYTLCALWEIDEIDLERGQLRLSGAGELVIRVYDVTHIVFDGGNAHSYFDVAVEGKAHNWYIHPWLDGRSFIADIGLRSSDGRFIVLARSNCVQMPRAAEAPGGAPQWMHVEGDPRKRQLVNKETSAPVQHPRPSITIPPSGLVELRPKELMTSVGREDVIEFYRALWRGNIPPQGP